MQVRVSELSTISSRRSLVISVGAALLCIIGTVCVINPVFYINDDAALHSILSGSVSGVPDAHAIYINYLICIPVVLLYQSIPQVPWFLICLELALLLACTALNYVIIRFAGRFTFEGVVALDLGGGSLFCFYSISPSFGQMLFSRTIRFVQPYYAEDRFASI